MQGFGLLVGHLIGDYWYQTDAMAKGKASDSKLCALHCVYYTLGVLLCSFWWLPWWAYPLVLVAHFPVDRWRLARRWMRYGHEEFATGPLAPWSVVAMDNIIHLVVLFVLGVLCPLLDPSPAWYGLLLSLPSLFLLGYLLSLLPQDPFEPLRKKPPTASYGFVFDLSLEAAQPRIFVPYLDSDDEGTLALRCYVMASMAGEKNSDRLATLDRLVRERCRLVKGGDRAVLDLAASPVEVIL